MAPDSVGAVPSAMAAQPADWVAMTLLAVTVAHVGVQMLAPHRFSVGSTVAVAVLPPVAILIDKALFVVEGLMYPVFRLYEGVPGSYSPSWVELSSLVDAISIVALFFLVAAKAVPVIEVEEASA
jgi:molybdopterin-containing oxidoreductase family membrane subunit